MNPLPSYDEGLKLILHAVTMATAATVLADRQSGNAFLSEQRAAERAWGEAAERYPHNRMLRDLFTIPYDPYQIARQRPIEVMALPYQPDDHERALSDALAACRTARRWLSEAASPRDDVEVRRTILEGAFRAAYRTSDSLWQMLRQQRISPNEAETLRALAAALDLEPELEASLL